MDQIKKLKSGFAAAALAVAMATTATVATAPAYAQKSGDRQVTLSIGKGQQINLSSPITDVVVTDPRVADVEVRSSKQIYIYGKAPGVADVFATDASGRTVYRATVEVGGNLDSLDQMLELAMPDADITVTTMNGVVLLTGTVAQPEDAAEAERLVNAFVEVDASAGGAGGAGGGESRGTTVVSRLKTATPLQVNLQVRIAEVSRSLAKEITGNLDTRDNDGPSGNGFLFGIGGANRDFVEIGDLPGGGTSYDFTKLTGVGLVRAAGRLFGLDVAAAFDLSESAGLISTLANPNLTTVSGETAEFQAGGSFPVLTSSDNGTTVSYEDYGVSVTYTPVVMADGRISMRVRSEVSEISSQGAIRQGGFEIPATTKRMAETTVELGSGQSMMIAGLLSNSLGNSVSKTPGLGDVPILGALFKSNGWRKNETELMIIVTPYLVKPVSDDRIKLPTDGLNSPNDAERVLLGKNLSDKGQTERPMPTLAPDINVAPGVTTIGAAAPVVPAKAKAKTAEASVAPAPGFSFNK